MNTIQKSVPGMLMGHMLLCSTVSAQVEQSGWGELRGIRVDGELFSVRSSIGVASPGYEDYAQTAHWRTRRQAYERDGDTIVSSGQIACRGGETVSFTQHITKKDERTARIELDAIVEGDMTVEGLFFSFRVPPAIYGDGGCLLMGTDAIVDFAADAPDASGIYRFGSASGIEFIGGSRRVEIQFDAPSDVVIEKSRDANNSDWPAASMVLARGDLKKGQTLRAAVTIHVAGAPEQAPATVTIDPSNRGRSFDGVGGNFCWGTGSPTVDYYLENLRVVWGRLNLPLNSWQPEEGDDPTARSPEDLPQDIRETLRMAGELHRRGIPMMISTWTAPDWAHPPRDRDAPRGRSPRPLAEDKVEAVARSVGAFLLTVKEAVGVEPLLFSFNEPNLGINVLESPEAHRDHIKVLGAHFDSLGLKTRMLLGDVNEPGAVNFVLATLEDEEAMKYVGAISYHSWNGGTDEQLRGWREHAIRAGVPLFVGEAGTDPDAHRYRPILNEPWSALDEAVSLLRCITFSQPQSILHWQLTTDYGFVKESDDPNQPITTSQRWFQYKQLSAMTPAGAAILAVESDTPAIAVAALAAEEQPVSVIHLANNGAEREVTIDGLGDGVGRMRRYVTDTARGMERIEPVNASDGKLTLTVPAMSFVSLVRATDSSDSKQETRGPEQ